ncbi:hypothetical protein OMW55_09500 [Sphingomonas sp. BN140010]|uniref:Uncharacterized protein n=1 Tax=Sphingomonas arvum TaxID=2992113 RepID=A0ABT3JG27_9SPHN|nr:hypothetical protein [Sphingomonas sp. BN140010]MCW3798037.1 hypothetical protein [Sphingomonas sp. BN140010]
MPVGRSRVALCGPAGIEPGAFGGGKRDWSTRVDYDLGGAALNLSRVGSARARAGQLGRNGLVLSVSRGC